MSTVGVGESGVTASDVVEPSSEVVATRVVVASDVGPLSLLIAKNLERFASRVGEVPASAVEEMTLAVAEISNVIYGVGAVPFEAHAHSVSQNFSKACRVLRAGTIAVTDKNAELLDNVAVAVGLLFEGLDLALAQQSE